VRQIVLLRGINLGPRNRVSMPELRERLAEAGFQDVGTYLQSGNIALSGDTPPDELAERVRSLIAESLGLDIEVVVRTRDELAEVVRRNPLKDVADNPKRYQVTFLSAELPVDRVEKLASVAVGDERLVAIGRELYAWHPDGVARSKLWNRLAASGLGVTATARNWTTVTSLLEMADDW
jgi:uncharacterized protein (DUF1697 family)